MQVETQLVDMPAELPASEEVVPAPSAATTPLTTVATPSPASPAPPDFTPEKVPEGIRLHYYKPVRVCL